MLRQAVRLQPKVMTLWLGSNDILGGVTAGTVVEGATVTPVAAYTALMDLALDTLLRETKAHIFIANIPSIVTIPYVTTVPKVVIDAQFPAGHHQRESRSLAYAGIQCEVRPVPGPGRFPKGDRHPGRPRRHRTPLCPPT